jgi:transposase
MIMIKDTQYRTLIKEFNKSGEITMSSIKSGMTRKTGSKYLKQGKGPSELRQPHTWRTRPDPFADVANEIDDMLKKAPELQPLTVFTYLQEKYPGKFDDGQLRTFERRIKEWKMEKGKAEVLSVPQSHAPGKLMELDWTCMNKLMITIDGVHFEHLLCHTIMTYSNWDWAEIAFSESFQSLKKGFQNAVYRLGAVPEILQTDNSSTATHQVQKNKKARDFNHNYKTFLDHYKVTPRSINVNSPDENGDIESANGHLKRRIDQYLLLRGSRNFSSIDEYRRFLDDILFRGNKNRAAKLKEELQVMRELPEVRLPEFIEDHTTVSSFGTIRVKKMAYSVPSRLKGEKIRIRVYEDKIELFSGIKCIATIPRKPGTGYCIDYRHVIETLRRKPGAFANCRYKDQLFPSEIFSEAYEQLHSQFNERLADREYIEILYLAFSHGEDRVSDILSGLIDGKERFTMETVKQELDIPMPIPKINRAEPDLFSYDGLLSFARRAICLLIH